MYLKAFKAIIKNKMSSSKDSSNTSKNTTSATAVVGFRLWDDLPSWSKGVIVVGGLAAIYFGVTETLKRLKKAEQNRKATAALEKTQQEITQYENKGIKPTYPESQYYSWADSIAKQFSGCDFEDGWGWSGSGAKLYNICYKMENDLDFAKFVAAYGIRSYDQCGFYPFSGSFTGNLTQAVSDELKESEVVGINRLLSQRGITYRFT